MRYLKVYDLLPGLDLSSELQEMLPLLPGWRRGKALSYRFEIDRFLSAKSFLMIEDLLREHFGLASCPEFLYGIHGKPYLGEYPDIHFNISHCKKGIACAVSDNPVGVDIEEIQYDAGLAGRVLNAEEFSSVRLSDEPDVRFAELWTCKEGLLKLSGEGIAVNLANVLSSATDISFETRINRELGYVVSLAFSEKNQ